MTLLRDISLLWSMLHVIALFLILFEPRFSWRTTLTVAFVVGGTLLIANILLMYQLGNGILMSVAFFTCTIPTLILFFILSKYRDGRFFFLFCMSDTLSFLVMHNTNLMDRMAGETKIDLLVSVLSSDYVYGHPGGCAHAGRLRGWHRLSGDAPHAPDLHDLPALPVAADEDV